MANMNNRKKTNVGRSDSNFINEMRELAKFRFIKNLEKKMPTDAEMTRLLRRTQGYRISIEELKKKPRKENI